MNNSSELRESRLVDDDRDSAPAGGEMEETYEPRLMEDLELALGLARA